MKIFGNTDPGYKYWAHHNLTFWESFNILISLGCNLSWMLLKTFFELIPTIIVCESIWWFTHISVEILYCFLTQSWFLWLSCVKKIIKTEILEDPKNEKKALRQNKLWKLPLNLINLWSTIILCFKETLSAGFNFMKFLQLVFDEKH